MSVSEWETESERAVESSREREIVREGYCAAKTGKPNFAIGQSLNGLKLFLSFICIYLQLECDSDPFRILGEILSTLKCSREIVSFNIEFSVPKTFSLVLTMKSNICLVLSCLLYNLNSSACYVLAAWNMVVVCSKVFLSRIQIYASKCK